MYVYYQNFFKYHEKDLKQQMSTIKPDLRLWCFNNTCISVISWLSF